MEDRVQSGVSFPISIGTALIHWAGYLVDVKRQGILNEGSIKYGISELLEVSKARYNDENENRQATGVKVNDYYFEQEHPYYLDRDIDLKIDVEFGELKSKKSSMYMEFKYVHKDENNNVVPYISENEIDRYFDDIFRLLSLVKKQNNSSAYFLVMGMDSDVGSVFMRDSNTRRCPIKAPGEGEVKKKTKKVECFNGLKVYFPEKVNEPVEYYLDEIITATDNSKTHISRFNGSYIPPKESVKTKTQKQKSEIILSEKDVLKINKIFDEVSDHTNEYKRLRVMIWEVSYRNEKTLP